MAQANMEYFVFPKPAYITRRSSVFSAFLRGYKVCKKHVRRSKTERKNDDPLFTPIQRFFSPSLKHMKNCQKEQEENGGKEPARRAAGTASNNSKKKRTIMTISDWHVIG